MGFADRPEDPAAKENFTLKLLSLQRPEIEELLTFLFRKLGYAVGETRWEGDLLYFHLIRQEEILAHHSLACWTGGSRILSQDFVNGFLKASPFSLPPEASFERGFFLSPYEFHASFREQAQKNSIELINGKTLSDLLIRHQLTYYFPSFLEIAGRWIWKAAPLVIPVLLVMYGIFVYLTLRPERAPALSPAPPSPSVRTPAPSPSPAAPVAPAVPPPAQKAPEKPKKMPANPAPKEFKEPEIPTTGLKPAAPRPKPKHPLTAPVRKPAWIQTPPPVREVRKVPPERVKRVYTGKPKKNYARKSGKKLNVPKQSAWHIIYKNRETVDLTEKYFSIARELEKGHYYSKARVYYLKYLKIAPDGAYADAAHEALKEMPAK